MICEHCHEASNQIALLSSGDPSKCCLECWGKFEADRERHREGFPEKWVQDRRDEEAAGCFDPNADPDTVRTAARRMKVER